MSFRVTLNGKLRPTEEYIAALEQNKYATKWADGTVVDGNDFTTDKLDEIALKHLNVGLTGFGIYQNPNASYGIRYDIIVAAAEMAGIDPPSNSRRAGDANKLVDWIEATQPIADEPMEKGLPKEGGRRSRSSSTSPGNTTGPETSPDDSPSAGC